MSREADIERRMALLAQDDGGRLIKFVSPSFRGMPDRLLLHPAYAQATFVEVKRPGGVVSPIQQQTHRLLRELGCDIHTLDDVDEFAKLIADLRRESE